MNKYLMYLLLPASMLFFLHGAAAGASLTAAEIDQIQTALGVTLSTNDIVQLSEIVCPSNMPAWRSEAYARIDAHRKAELDIRVVDQYGNPVEGAEVNVQLKRNQFKFGGVCTVQDLTDADGNLSAEGSTSNDWKRITTNLFNTAGLNNGFKPKLTSGHQYISAFTNWAAENNLPVRGHLLMWPGGGHLADLDNPAAVAGVDYGDHLSNSSISDYATHDVLGAVDTYKASARGASDKAALKAEVDAEISEWASQWNVYEWDVMNETIGNNLLQEILGWDQMAEWFKIAESNKVSAETGLLINEFKIISADHTDDGSTYLGRKISYMDRIDTVISDGGPITGIGFQSRFNYGHIDPATVYSRLDDFATMYPDMTFSGTEFEMTEKNGYIYNEFERAQMTEEILTAYFSHDQVVGLNAWDFMSASTNATTNSLEYTAAMAWYDGTVKLNGLVWYYLHRIRYNTDATLSSGLDGRTGLRAFKGDYDVRVTYKGQEYSSALTLTNNEAVVITLTSSVADNSNVSAVIDAWSYDGLTNGAGLASAVSTGLVGGASTPDSVLASIQNETVRWQSVDESLATGLFRNIVPSSSAGASNGIYQLSVDYLDADFSGTAAVTYTNGNGRVGFGVRRASDSKDVNFRLVFDGGSGTSPQYWLQVSDDLGVNQTVATFPGTSLDQLNVRAVYDFDTAGSGGSYQVYYRLNGGSEVAAYTGGQLPDAFALDQMRAVVQTYNGGAYWVPGDRIYTDNLVLSTMSEPLPAGFVKDPISRADAAVGTSYAGQSIAGTASNAMFYSKVSGPAWLTVTANGDLSGTPTGNDPGPNSWIVQVSNGFNTDTAVLHINVTGSGTSGPGGTVTVVDTASDGFSTSSGAITGTVSTAVSTEVGDVIVVAAATNKRGDVSPITLTQTGGTGATGPQTVTNNLMSTYPTSWGWYMTVTQAGTFTYELTSTNITAGAALYVLRSDTGQISLIDAATWDDNDTADNGSTYSLSYDFGTSLTNGVVIEAISSRTDLVAEPSAYTENFNGSNLRVVVSYGGISGSSWGSVYSLSGGIATKQTSGAVGMVFVGMTDPVTNSAPVFDGDPVVEAGAIQGAAYSSSLTNSATDGDSDPLSFFKVSGPAWLTVSENGALSGTPSSGDLGTNSWKVALSDGISTNFATLQIAVSDPMVTPQTRYDDWTTGFAGFGNTALGGDPDGDGRDNLVEYALGGDPTVPDRAIAPQVRLSGNYLQFVYVRRSDALDRGLSYWLETSPALLPPVWTNANYEITGTNLSYGVDGFDEITNRIPAGTENRQFIRLRVQWAE